MPDDECLVYITERGFDRKALEKFDSCTVVKLLIPADYNHLAQLLRCVDVLKSGSENRGYFRMAGDYWTMRHLVGLIGAAGENNRNWELSLQDGVYVIEFTRTVDEK